MVMLWMAVSLSSAYGGIGSLPLPVTSMERWSVSPPMGVPGCGEFQTARPGVRTCPLSVVKLRDQSSSAAARSGSRAARVAKERILNKVYEAGEKRRSTAGSSSK